VAFVSYTLPAPLVAAQTFHGGVRGRVVDASGQPVAATLELIDERTGLVRGTASNELGEYVFAGVLTGEYRLRASAAGFKTYERQGLRIGTQTFLTIDVALEVGGVTELVTVAADAPLVATANASVSALVDRTMLDLFPSAGRNVFITAAATTATVLATGDAQFVRQQDQSNSSLISMAGGPRRNNTYVLDGVPIVDVLNRATLIPNFQAVEEIRVQLSPYDADVGRTSGGVFNTTARSGSNDWHGSALYQNRPDSAVGRLFFAERNDIPNPDTYYHLYGGSFGGPLRRNQTFFWASTEGYRTSSTRNTVLFLPTEAERRGDFSQSGVTIYDPLTTRPDPSRPGHFMRDPFPNNQIPANRLHPVSQALLKYVPMPTAGKSRPAVARIVDRADQITGKVTHRWADQVTSTALYAWYESMEPDAAFYGGPLFDNPADPGGGAFVRGATVVALNSAWTPTARSVVAMRYGFTDLSDDNRPADFDPSGLGFDPAFLSAVPLRKFPNVGVTDYGRGGSFLGDRFQDKATYDTHTASASVTTLLGRQTFKIGGEYRRSAVRFYNVGGMGSFDFDRSFTFGPHPDAPALRTGDGFATFLLGAPTSGGISVGSPLDVRLGYWSAFVQDDFRVTPRLTLNFGMRYDFEQGLRERQDRIITGWASDTPFPVQVGGQRPDGTPLVLTGGVRYAGVEGAASSQGDPNRLQFAPRLGAVYAIDDRTSIRSGYGLFWAPSQGLSADEAGSGTPGYNIGTAYVATGANPFIPCTGCSLTNPFPSGINQPRGSGDGRLTGVGNSITFIDPESHLGYLHRFSADLQRELPGSLAVSVGYLGARGRELMSGIGGYGPNINQLDPSFFALGPSLQEPVTNPFLGTPLGVGILAGPTVPRGQLLRPYPQFDGVFRRRQNLAKSRYDAMILTADRRLRDGWAAHLSYTWSRTLDSQFSESNFFAGGSGLLNNHDVDAEYGLSVLDTPHRLTLNGVVELPFGEGRRWFNQRGLAAALLGGWSISAVGTYQAGFPVTVIQNPNNSNLLGSGQRPNVRSGVDPYLADDPEDSYDPGCGCIRWLNPAAWSQAAPFTFGNAPRTDARVRTPARGNWDVAIDKSQRLGAARVSVRAEIINLLNNADLRGPNISFGSTMFGEIREVGGFPRMLQLSARVAW
jgi:hypothetical protein